MKLSQLFTKTQKTYPKDEVSSSAQLLIRAGYTDKVAAGIYTLLPLGLKMANRVSQVIREEMDALGAQEILMPALIPKANWQKTGRFETFDSLFRLKGGDDREYGLGATHEEIITPLLKKYIFSYKDLPRAVYQIQNKFRDEPRAKSGILRTREFLMKDLYSFHESEEDLDDYYEKVKGAYWKIFDRLKIKERTHLTFASGGAFSKYSHEFQTETEAGEDEIYVCRACSSALNRELLDGDYRCLECSGEEYELKKCVEVGNIFKLGDRFAQAFGFRFSGASGREKVPVMGCYGIGVQRLMGTIVEVNRDQKGMVLPASTAPFAVHLIALEGKKEQAGRLYDFLLSKGIEVLYDDREEASAGEKFADADLIGLPARLVVSEKAGDKIEFKPRAADKAELISKEDLLKKLS